MAGTFKNRLMNLAQILNIDVSAAWDRQKVTLAIPQFSGTESVNATQVEIKPYYSTLIFQSTDRFSFYVGFSTESDAEIDSDLDLIVYTSTNGSKEIKIPWGVVGNRKDSIYLIMSGLEGAVDKLYIKVIKG